MAEKDYSAPVRYAGDPNRPNDPYGGVDDPNSPNSKVYQDAHAKPNGFMDWLSKSGGKYFAIALGLGFVAAIAYGAIHGW